MSLARPVSESTAQPVSPAYILRAQSGAFPAPTVKITALGGIRPQANAAGEAPARIERPDRRLLDRALRDAAGITQRPKSVQTSWAHLSDQQVLRRMTQSMSILKLEAKVRDRQRAHRLYKQFSSNSTSPNSQRAKRGKKKRRAQSARQRSTSLTAQHHGSFKLGVGAMASSIDRTSPPTSGRSHGRRLSLGGGEEAVGRSIVPLSSSLPNLLSNSWSNRNAGFTETMQSKQVNGSLFDSRTLSPNSRDRHTKLMRSISNGNLGRRLGQRKRQVSRARLASQ